MNRIHRWIIRQHDVTLIALGFATGVAVAVTVHILGAYWPWMVVR